MEEFDGQHAGMIVGKRERSTGKHRIGKEQHFSLANHRGQIPATLWLQCQHKLERNRQVGGRGRGKHTWLSGLMKCASCGYSIKVNREGEKYYLLCSGRSNLGLCQERIQVDLRALERAVAEELDWLLERCPQEEIAPENPETKQALSEIDRKMERLMAALTESSALTMKYINQTIQTLEERRAELLRRQTVPEPCLAVRRLAFGALAFEEKKWVAAQLIQEIRLSGDRAEVIWKV